MNDDGSNVNPPSGDWIKRRVKRKLITLALKLHDRSCCFIDFMGCFTILLKYTYDKKNTWSLTNTRSEHLGVLFRQWIIDSILFSQVQKHRHCAWCIPTVESKEWSKVLIVGVKELEGEFQKIPTYTYQLGRFSTEQQQQNWTIQVSFWQNSHRLHNKHPDCNLREQFHLLTPEWSGVRQWTRSLTFSI